MDWGQETGAAVRRASRLLEVGSEGIGGYDGSREVSSWDDAVVAGEIGVYGDAYPMEIQTEAGWLSQFVQFVGNCSLVSMSARCRQEMNRGWRGVPGLGLMSTSNPLNFLVRGIASRLAEVLLLLETCFQRCPYNVSGPCFLAGAPCPAHMLGTQGLLGTLVWLAVSSDLGYDQIAGQAHSIHPELVAHNSLGVQSSNLAAADASMLSGRYGNETFLVGRQRVGSVQGD